MPALRPVVVAAFAAALAAGPAAAQVTPEQVWTAWKGLAGDMGYTLTATAERRDGDRLVLDGVLATMLAETHAMRAPMGQVVLRDRGDGTVEITLEPAFDITMTVTEPDSEPVEMALSLEQEGYTAVVSGTPEALAYDFSAAALTIGMSAPRVDGKEMPLDMTVTLGGLAGSARTLPGDPMGLASDLSAEALELAVSAENPEGEGTFDLSLGAEALQSSFQGAMPQAPAQAMTAGLTGKGSYGTGPIEFAFDVDDKGKTSSVAGRAAGSGVEFGLDPAGLSYRGTVTGAEVTLAGSDIPFPQLTVTLGEYTMGLTMPLTRSDTAADFALLLRLVDLGLPDEIWSMLDPAASLPRDPATLVLDTSGKVQLFHDLTSPEAQGEGAPGQVESVTINALQLKAAGADLTGTGAFAFDNTDTETFGGMPRPTGSADLTLTGGNTLLDRLVALGVVPPDQVMVARAMLAMFARPGAGPDTLTSKLEITPEGQILANGQRIQ